MSKPRLAAGFALLVLSSREAQAEAISERDAVARALARNPAYAASLAQVDQAVASLRSAEARLDPTLTLAAGATRSRNPTLSLGTTLTSTTLQLSADATLRKKLIGGTEFTFSLGSTWQRNQTPFTSGGAGAVVATTPTLITTGPAYGLTARVGVTQPLLRGAGRDVGLAAQREAQVSRRTAQASQERSASELMRDTLSAYWELWYAEAAERIQKTALDTALRQRDDAVARRDTGSLAPAEVLTFETELRQAEESLVQARIEVRSRSAELKRLLGSEEVAGLEATDIPPVPSPLNGDQDQAILDASPELAERRAEVELAEIRARTAEDSYRARLDLDAYVQAQGLGNRDAGAAVGQVTGLDAVSAHVGLTYELPLDRRRQQAEGERARQAILVARHNHEATRQRLLASGRTLQDKISGARRRVELAEGTTGVARASLQAEQERFRTGSSTALSVLRAQDQLRSAELRLARARVDLASAHAGLLHLTGRLLKSAS